MPWLMKRCCCQSISMWSSSMDTDEALAALLHTLGIVPGNGERTCNMHG